VQEYANKHDFATFIDTAYGLHEDRGQQIKLQKEEKKRLQIGLVIINC
jgi:hypothetical protein